MKQSRISWKKKVGRGIRLVLTAARKFDADHGFFLSSGITFNILICFIPSLLLLLALAGTYLNTSREIMTLFRHYLESISPNADPRIMRNILRVVQDRKIVGVIGMAGLLWTSTWVFASMRTAFNIIFEVEKGRGILHGKAIDLLMILLTEVFVFMSLVLTSIMTFLGRHRSRTLIDLGPMIQWTLKYVVPFLFTYWMFFWIYKIMPFRKIRLRPALEAAFFTSLLWEMAKQLFGWYVSHLEGFSVIYGSVSTLAIFVLWIFYSSAILLLGGEIAFLLHQDHEPFRIKERGGRIVI
jgi:membrane protein